MKLNTTGCRLKVATILIAMCLSITKTWGSALDTNDSVAKKLLQEVRVTFNQNDERAFYEASDKYKDYQLKKNDLKGYYLSWKNEVLYDVNHNHFYRALRKTMAMQNDMEKRGMEKEFYKTTHLRGIIYSLRGNIKLAHQYFEKALEQVDHSQPGNLVALYMDMANIEMDSQPLEAMKHLDCAIEMIKAKGSGYEYSDAIGFKIILAYTMHDWDQVNKLFTEYLELQKSLGQDFSSTYFNYALICKAVADKRYSDAIRQTNELTNTTDIYKFQTEIYELAGETELALASQKRYMTVKDSVNNVIMSEEMVGSANDLQDAELLNETVAKRNQLLTWIINIIIFGALFIGFLIYRFNRLRYLKNLQSQYQELLIAQDKAHEAERMKMSFLQNMSHEIRTPLNVICGYAQVIGDPGTLMTAEEKQDICERITHSSQSLVRIVNEILDIASKESIHFIDKNDHASCNSLAREVIQPYLNKQDHSKVSFEPLLKDSFMITTNRKEVEKILNHLIDNAMKFTQNGSVTLRTYQDNLDHLICFSVTDTGCGIKEGDEEKVFEHFYKSDIYKEGVGLGLSLARRVARQMGGDVVLDSRYKEGSRFILKLPKE